MESSARRSGRSRYAGAALYSSFIAAPPQDTLYTPVRHYTQYNVKL